MSKLVGKLHVFILLWVVFSVYEKYDSHMTKINEMENRIPVIKTKIKRKIKN